MDTECGKLRPVCFIGCALFIMELLKQFYLWRIYFHGTYNVWYFPFQMCSLPMYLGPLCWLLRKKTDRAGVLMRQSALIFLQDYGLLGGIAALAVPDGFTYAGHPLLTMHGYLWHILMIVMAIYIWRAGPADCQRSKGFQGAFILYLLAAGIAEMINIVLHPFGDCDMFYISPYHLSVQPLFHEIDGFVGRPIGIVLYLLSVSLGALLIHLFWDRCFVLPKNERHG